MGGSVTNQSITRSNVTFWSYMIRITNILWTDKILKDPISNIHFHPKTFPRDDQGLCPAGIGTSLSQTDLSREIYVTQYNFWQFKRTSQQAHRESELFWFVIGTISLENLMVMKCVKICRHADSTNAVIYSTKMPHKDYMIWDVQKGQFQ